MREKEKEKEIEEEMGGGECGVSPYKATSSMGLGPYPYDLV